MSLRTPLSLFAAMLVGTSPALAAAADAPTPRSCFRPDTAPPGKSLVTVRVVRCPQARQVSETDRRPPIPDAPRRAVD